MLVLHRRQNTPESATRHGNGDFIMLYHVTHGISVRTLRLVYLHEWETFCRRPTRVSIGNALETYLHEEGQGYFARLQAWFEGWIQSPKCVTRYNEIIESIKGDVFDWFNLLPSQGQVWINTETAIAVEVVSFNPTTEEVIITPVDYSSIHAETISLDSFTRFYESEQINPYHSEPRIADIDADTAT